jgi:hypothetical protein
LANIDHGEHTNSAASISEYGKLTEDKELSGSVKKSDFKDQVVMEYG